MKPMPYVRMNLMFFLAVVGILSSTISFASEKQSFTAGFDCTKASSIIEIKICGNKRLANQDRRLNILYKKITQNLTTPDKSKFRKEQSGWLKNRDSLCGSSKNIIECIEDAYSQRIELLEIIKLWAVKKTPYDTFRIEENPSLVPLRTFPEEPYRSGERYRVFADFNNDDIIDIALSHDTNMFGNAGGHFSLYIGMADGQYRKIGSFFAHPAAINLNKTIKGFGLISTYHKGGSGRGVIVKQQVTSDGVFFLEKYAIDPGDNGPIADRKLYEKLFKSESSLKSEISQTKGGIVNWKPDD